MRGLQQDEGGGSVKTAMIFSDGTHAPMAYVNPDHVESVRVVHSVHVDLGPNLCHWVSIDMVSGASIRVGGWNDDGSARAAFRAAVAVVEAIRSGGIYDGYDDDGWIE